MECKNKIQSWILLLSVKDPWRNLAFVLLGFALGLGAWTFRLANATSYLSDAPETCINCHVMGNAYATWQRGSHGKVAVCNDCHVPHTNPVAKFAFKGKDGLRHATVFSLRLEPQTLRLNPDAVPVVQGNCTRCHAERFGLVRLFDSTERRCWDCHQNIHGEVRGLSASPYVRRPQLTPAGF